MEIMMTIRLPALASLAGMLSAAIIAGNVQAAPFVPQGPAATAADAKAVTEVQWRRDYRGRGGWGRGAGPFFGGLAAGAIIGGTLAQRPYESYGYGDDDAFARCAATYRSFDPATGTYTTYGGETRTCPYL
jgi:BA14K-like protein